MAKTQAFLDGFFGEIQKPAPYKIGSVIRRVRALQAQRYKDINTAHTKKRTELTLAWKTKKKLATI